MLLKLFSQHSPRLNEEAAIDSLVRHVQTHLVRIGPFEPAGDLFRRPIQCELAGHYIPELPIQCESAQFWTTRPVPGMLICLDCTIRLRPSVSRDLTADRRRCTMEC